MNKIIKFICSWKLTLILILLLVIAKYSAANLPIVLYLLADDVSDKKEIVIGSNKIRTLGCKIAMEDYFDCTDSLNTALLVNKDYSCVVSGINPYSGGNFLEFADSLSEIQSMRDSDRLFSGNIYEVANDTIYYYQSKYDFTTVNIFIPNRNLYLGINDFKHIREDIRSMINEMIYYDQDDPNWKEIIMKVMD